MAERREKMLGIAQSTSTVDFLVPLPCRLLLDRFVLVFICRVAASVASRALVVTILLASTRPQKGKSGLETTWQLILYDYWCQCRVSDNCYTLSRCCLLSTISPSPWCLVGTNCSSIRFYPDAMRRRKQSWSEFQKFKLRFQIHFEISIWFTWFAQQ
jgi:hypothetical protein